METTQAVVVKEDKKTLVKIWDRMSKSFKREMKVKRKLGPVALTIVSVIYPETAPIMLALSKFLKSKPADELEKIESELFDAVSDYLNGDKESAKERIDEVLNYITSDDGIKDMQDAKRDIDDMIELSGGMTK